MLLSDVNEKLYKNIPCFFRYTLLIANLFAGTANAGQVPSAALASPLPQQPGANYVTPEMLLKIKSYGYDNEASCFNTYRGD